MALFGDKNWWSAKNNADYVYLLRNEYYENYSAKSGRPLDIMTSIIGQAADMGITMPTVTRQVNPMRTAVNRVVQAWIEDEELARTATLAAVEQDVATTLTIFNPRR